MRLLDLNIGIVMLYFWFVKIICVRNVIFFVMIVMNLFVVSVWFFLIISNISLMML